MELVLKFKTGTLSAFPLHLEKHVCDNIPLNVLQGSGGGGYGSPTRRSYVALAANCWVVSQEGMARPRLCWIGWCIRERCSY